MNGKKARKLRKELNPLARIIVHHSKQVKFRKPERFQVMRRVKNAYLSGGIDRYFMLIKSIGLDVNEIKDKYFKFA